MSMCACSIRTVGMMSYWIIVGMMSYWIIVVMIGCRISVEDTILVLGLWGYHCGGASIVLASLW